MLGGLETRPSPLKDQGGKIRSSSVNYPAISVPFANGNATHGLGCTATLAGADEQMLELLHRLMQTEGYRR